jgi:hypothetical protein
MSIQVNSASSKAWRRGERSQQSKVIGAVSRLLMARLYAGDEALASGRCKHTQWTTGRLKAKGAQREFIEALRVMQSRDLRKTKAKPKGSATTYFHPLIEMGTNPN